MLDLNQRSPRARALHFLRADLASVDSVTQIGLKVPPHEDSLRIELTHSGSTRLLVEGADYTISGLTVTLTSAMISGDTYTVSMLSLYTAPSAAVVNTTLFPAILALNPFGFWKLLETTGNFVDSGSGAHDLSPGALTTSGGSLTRGVASIIPTEASLAASNSGHGANFYIGSISASVLPMGSGQSATFLTAVKPSSLNTSDDSCLMWQGNVAVGGSEGGGFVIGASGELKYECGASTYTASGTGIVLSGTDALIACVIDAVANTVKFYKNGGLVSTTTGWTFGTGSSAAGIWRIGEKPGITSGQLQGTMQGAALWTSALSAAQMLQLAQAGGFA